MRRIYLSSLIIVDSDPGGGATYLRACFKHTIKNNKNNVYFVCAKKVCRKRRKRKNIGYISRSYRFSIYFIALITWYLIKGRFSTRNSTVVFHRNYAAWPHYIFKPKNSKVIITCHGRTGFGLKNSSIPFKGKIEKIVRYFECKAFKQADKVIFVSERDMNFYVKELKYYIEAITIPAPVAEIFINKTGKIKDDEANKLICIGRLER